ncbi:MAG: hypothetical protein IJT62_01970 [Oscillospiraceae bacterium]|nr:hypothetical protein [Oscillospiraceae bacterium]
MNKLGLRLFLLGLLCLAGVVFLLLFTVVDGRVYYRHARTVDLRSRDVTAEQVSRLEQALPGTDVLWNVRIGGEKYPNDTESLTISALRKEDLPAFAYLHGLREIDASDCRDYEILAALEKAYPEVTVRWQVALGEALYTADAAEIELRGPVDSRELSERLRYFSRLKSVTVPDGILSLSDQTRLRAEYPSLAFVWNVPMGEKTFPADSVFVSLAGDPVTDASLEELKEALDLMPTLQELDLTGSGLSEAGRRALADYRPGTEMRWDTVICGVEADTLAEELILNGVPVEDISEIENALPYFPRLKKVEMCLCGVDNETMDALNKRHEDVEFVWMVQVRHFGVRTDATYFSQWNVPYKFSEDLDLDNFSLDELRYCPHMRAMDLGKLVSRHCNLSCLHYLPELEYLVISKCAVRNLDDLRGLDNLIWLEMFLSQVEDISALADLPNLQYLNIGTCWYIRDKEAAVETLKKCTNLKLLLVTYGVLTEQQVEELREALPDARIYLKDSEVDQVWRGDKSFFDMRDAIHMYYIDWNGNEIPVNPYTGEENQYRDTNPFV